MHIACTLWLSVLQIDNTLSSAITNWALWDPPSGIGGSNPPSPTKFFLGIIAAIRFSFPTGKVLQSIVPFVGDFNEIVSEAPCFDNKMLFCANKLTMLLGIIVRGPPGNSRYKRVRRGGSLGS
jgi:hypothetical protein